MILERLEVEAFRCFVRRFVLGPFDERLTVVHGPNGAGKSTLLLAALHLFFDRPEAHAPELERLVPWGTSLPPQAAVDFAEGKERFRLEKSFGPRGKTRLFRREGRELQPWMEGTPAVEWVRARFGGRPPARGATRPEHWGLGQVLFVPQAEVPLPEQLGEGALERLRAVVDDVLVGPVAREVKAEVKRRHEATYTAAGQLKKGSPLGLAEARLAEARARVEAARARRAALDALHARHEAAVAEVAALDARWEEERARRAALAPRVEEQRRLAAARQPLVAALAQARERFEALALTVQKLADLRERVARDEGARAAAATARAVAEAAAGEAAARHAAARQAVAALDEERAALVAEHNALAAARRLAALAEEVAELDGRLGALEAAQNEAAALRAALAELPPAALRPRLAALRAAEETAARAAARLEALALRVTITARRAVDVEGAEGKRRLAAGERLTLSGEGELRLVVGAAELELRGPAVDLAEARRAHDEARRAADDLAASLAGAAPAALEAGLEARQEKEAALAVVEERLRGLLRGAPDRAALARKRDELEAERQAILAARPGIDGARDEVARRAARLAELETALDERRRAAVAEEVEAGRAAEVAAAAERKAAARLGAAERELAAQKGRIAELTADGQDDAARTEARYALSRAVQEAEDRLRAVDEALARLGDPEAELRAAQAALDQLAEARVKAEKELAHLAGEVEEAATGSRAGGWRELAEAEEALAEAEAAEARDRLDAAAFARLSALFAEEEARVARALAEPVKDKVAPRLRRLVGGELQEVLIDERFHAGGVVPKGQRDAVPEEALSHGTRDQLALLVRLALGEILAAERLPAILDDPLVHADRSRLRRFLAVLEEASRKLQLIVFTCRPEDYRGLPRARFIDLHDGGDLFDA